MRTTHTFVLRLWIDTDEPNALRGLLHSVADDADYPFANAQALLDLLSQMACDARIDADKNQGVDHSPLARPRSDENG